MERRVFTCRQAVDRDAVFAVSRLCHLAPGGPQPESYFAVIYNGFLLRAVRCERPYGFKAVDTDLKAVDEFKTRLAGCFIHTMGREGKMMKSYHQVKREGVFSGSLSWIAKRMQAKGLQRKRCLMYLDFQANRVL
ncbi:hypothetical protein KCU59_g94, partial [Aureobasidium melanogenum]